MGRISQSMMSLIEVFNEYAKAEGTVKTLTKKEVKTLFEEEIPSYLMGGKNQEEVDKLIQDLDEDGDSEVNFSEFMILISKLTCTFYKML
ncbi:protein S100-P-like [Centroberyx affinis]|uniref:protein S100-P-like n=1 Tax=Centroberyx affinis TaxID=166261 RepID=UPI003A5BB702